MASMGLKTDAAELEDACRQALRTMRRDHKIPCPFSPIGQRALVVGGRLPEMVACLDNVICRGSGFNSWAAFKSHVHNAAKADEECHMTLWRCMEDGDARRFDGHEVSDPIMLWIDFSDEAKEQEYNSSRLLAEKYASFFPSECLPVFHRDGFARRALLVWRTDNSISALALKAQLACHGDVQRASWLSQEQWHNLTMSPPGWFSNYYKKVNTLRPPRWRKVTELIPCASTMATKEVQTDLPSVTTTETGTQPDLPPPAPFPSVMATKEVQTDLPSVTTTETGTQPHTPPPAPSPRPPAPSPSEVSGVPVEAQTGAGGAQMDGCEQRGKMRYTKTNSYFREHYRKKKERMTAAEREACLEKDRLRKRRCRAANKAQDGIHACCGGACPSTSAVHAQWLLYQDGRILPHQLLASGIGYNPLGSAFVASGAADSQHLASVLPLPTVRQWGWGYGYGGDHCS